MSTDGWSVLPNWVVRDAPLDNGEKLLFIALLNRANSRGESWPSLSVLSKDTGLSESTVKRRLKKLVGLGMIEKINRKTDDGEYLSNLYKVNVWQPGGLGQSDHTYGQGDPTLGQGDLLSTKQEVQPKKVRRKPETTLPDDWVPTDGHLAYARESGIDLSHESEQFKNWALAKDVRYRDWNAGFRTWLGNARKWAKPVAPEPKRNIITDWDD